MQFLKYTLASLLGLIIFSVVGFFVFIGLVSAFSAEEPVVVKENSLLYINLNRPIAEMEYEDPFAQLAPFAEDPSTYGIIQLKSAIEHAAEDENIKGIYLEAPVVMAGFALSEELRDALLKFRESGKFVISYADLYTEGGYYLSSVADEVLMYPEGMVELNGINSTVLFFKGLLDKLEIEAQIFRAGEFKSAVEPFMRDDMSEENRLQVQELLSSVSDHMKAKLAGSRGISIDEMTSIIDGMKVRSPQDAVEMGFVDELMYKDEFIDHLRTRLEIGEDEDPNLISYSNYRKTYSDYSAASETIAVIVAEGDIMSSGGDQVVVGRKFAKLIRDAREDESVKAIVFRINSLGGELQPSDMIWREVKLAAEEKTVIASFSDYATSGGYYIGLAADTIVSSPTTVTGSIGIFGMLFNAGPMLENKLGITSEEVNTGEFSGLFSPLRAMSDSERAIVQNQVDRGYSTFISRVSEGRKMDPQVVGKIAGGRVWSGSQALEIGLVDQFGGIGDAIELAAANAGLDEYRIYYYPKKKTLLEEILEIGNNSSGDVLQSELGQYYPAVSRLKNLMKYQGIQARTPWEIQFSY